MKATEHQSEIMEYENDDKVESDDEFDINSYIEVNIDQSNENTIVKNEMGVPSYSNYRYEHPIVKCETDIKREPNNVDETEETLKYFQCNRCDYKTKRRYEMKNHIAANHFGVRFKCD